MQDDRGLSFFGGKEGRLPGFNLGDDNVPPWVKAERVEAIRKRKEKEQAEQDDLAARRFMEERLRKEEEEERQRAALRSTAEPASKAESASTAEPASCSAQSGGMRNDDADWDDENYATPPQNARPVHRAQPVPQVHKTTAEPAGGAGRVNNPPHSHMPLWQKLSGLNPQQEAKMTRDQRRRAIRTLLKQYEMRIRESLDEFEREQREAASAPPPLEGGGWGEGLNERTFLWSPLDAICFELGIVRRKLSAYTRELTGMSAQEVIDKIRAENISARLKEKLAARAKDEYEQHFANAEKTYRKRVPPPEHPTWMLLSNKISAEQLEREKQEAKLRAEIGMNCEPKCGWASAAGGLCSREWESRRAQPCIAWAENSRYAARQQFARELGFSSYNKLYRACLLAHGKTLMELEHAAALELLQALDKDAAPRREAVKAEVCGAGCQPADSPPAG